MHNFVVFSQQTEKKFTPCYIEKTEPETRNSPALHYITPKIFETKNVIGCYGNHESEDFALQVCFLKD